MHINIQICVLGGVSNKAATNCVYASVWYKTATLVYMPVCGTKKQQKANIKNLYTPQCLVHKSKDLCMYHLLVQNSVLVLKAGASAPSP